MKHKTLVFAAFILGVFTLSTHAQIVVIASYEFTGTTAAEVAPTSQHAGVSASDFSSPVFSFLTDTNDLRTNEDLGLADGGDDNMAGAIAAQQYVTFTVTANSGYTFDLFNLTFDIGRNLRGAQDYAIRSSVDSFAENIVFADQAISQTIAGQNIDLNNASYYGLTSIEFRIYLDDRVNNSASLSETFIDNVILNGTVAAIPEPSTFAVLTGFFVLAAAALRRTRPGEN